MQRVLTREVLQVVIQATLIVWVTPVLAGEHFTCSNTQGQKSKDRFRVSSVIYEKERSHQPCKVCWDGLRDRVHHLESIHSTTEYLFLLRFCHILVSNLKLASETGLLIEFCLHECIVSSFEKLVTHNLVGLFDF